MNRSAAIRLLLQSLLIGWALLMGKWVAMPWTAIAGLGLLAASLFAVEVATAPQSEGVRRWGLVMAWIATFVLPFSLLLEKHSSPALDGSYALLAWMVAAAISLTGNHATSAVIKTRWRLLGMTWAQTGVVIWLAASYLQNDQGAFHFGLLVVLALLILCRLWFRMRVLGVQAVNTLILLLVGLPLVDLFVRSSYLRDTPPETRTKYLSYEDAKRDPRAFASWWKYYLEQTDQIRIHLHEPDPAGVLPFRLRPKSQCLIGQCPVSLNSNGMRGREIPVDKGDAYRIVALGESTTFGITINKEDKPWPELLEQMIWERLHPRRPVEVINAGVPAFSLQYNLHRLHTEILPLKPDMIISYHGINGFFLLSPALPKMSGVRPPAYKERPLKLLADSEYNLKMLSYRRRYKSQDVMFHPVAFPDPMGTEYAKGYGRLIQFADTNDIRLVLANFSMAVNNQSDVDVIQFYRTTFPFVYMQIQANAVHSTIVKQLAAQHPDICPVDTHPHLDGHHEKFADMVHFTQQGRQQLAETMFAGIKKILEEDLLERRPPDSK